MSTLRIVVLALIGASIAACSQPTLPDPEPADTTYGGDSDVSTSGMGNDDPYSGTGFDEDEGPDTVIYFDFDSSEVRSVDRDTVRRHAQMLTDNPRQRVRLEGHADERGSREYNIGLGERRAQSVRQLLMIQGVSAEQIQTVSFGEERPQSMGSTEADYAQNRRVVFVHTN